MRAVVRGIALGILVFVLWCLASAMVMAHANARVEPDGWHSFFQLGWHQIFLVGAMVQSGSYLFAAFELGRQFDPWWWLLDSLGLLMLSALVSLVCAVIGMRWAGRAPRLEPDDPGASFVRDLNEPLFAKGFFRRRRDRVLEKNPMRWLLERSRTARLHRAGWLALVTVVESVMTLDGRALDISALALWQQGLLLALSVGLAVSSGMSFLEEKRTGAMELILVTPLQVRQIIFGRWRGLLGQFIPSLFLVGLVLLFSYSIRLSWQRAEPLSYVMGETGLFSFVSVPFVGMLASMLFRNLAASLAMTLAVPLLNFLSFVALLWLGSLVETPGHVPVEEAVVRYVQVTGWFLILPLNVWVAVKACQKLALLLGARTSRA